MSVLVCFDHEEVGSDSTHGAGSPIMKEIVERVNACFGVDAGGETFKLSLRKSFVISADVAHAVHPNYSSKHETNHGPLLNKGTVIKTNNNQRYATSATTGFVIRELSRQASVGVQEFVVRNVSYASLSCMLFLLTQSICTQVCTPHSTCANLSIFPAACLASTGSPKGPRPAALPRFHSHPQFLMLICGSIRIAHADRR